MSRVPVGAEYSIIPVILLVGHHPSFLPPIPNSITLHTCTVTPLYKLCTIPSTIEKNTIKTMIIFVFPFTLLHSFRRVPLVLSLLLSKTHLCPP